jgi:hypothetical protein
VTGSMAVMGSEATREATKGATATATATEPADARSADAPIRLWKPGEEPTGEAWVRWYIDSLRRQIDRQWGQASRASDPEHNFRAQGIRVI